jgi:hypothetical protein
MFKRLFKFYLKTLNEDDILFPYWNDEKFDGEITFKTKWIHPDTLTDFLKNGNKNYTTDDIIYEINKYGYRTSEKTNDIFNDNLIACFGCSNTYGVGLPYEETWVSLLNKHLGDKWCVKNYGAIGASNDMISRLIYNYIINNKPKIICCYFPEITRIEIVDDNKNFLINCSFISNFNYKYFENIYNKNVLKRIKNTYDAYKIIYNEKTCMFNFIKNIKFIEAICKLNNIDFYWSTWSSFPSFMSNDIFEKYFDIKKFININSIENDYARDNIHFGKLKNEKIADSFFYTINKN